MSIAPTEKAIPHKSVQEKREVLLKDRETLQNAIAACRQQEQDYTNRLIATNGAIAICDQLSPAAVE